MNRLFREGLKRSDNYAVRDSDGLAKTYKEIFHEIRLWSCIMETRSVVCVLCDNRFETICFILEMLAAGQVLWILDADTEETLLDRLIDLYRPHYIWIGKEAGEYLISKFSLQAALVEAGYSEHQLYRTLAQPYSISQDLALLLSTSGSTGSPKMVRISYENIRDCCKRIFFHYHIDSREKTVVTLPLHHIFSLSIYVAHWYYGASVLVINEPLGSRKFKDIYIRECVNSIIGVPFTFKMLRKTAFWDQKTLEHLHFAMSGGAKLLPKEQEWLVANLHEKFWIEYGQTETTSLIIGTNFDRASDKPGTIGRALEGVDVSFTDEEELVIHAQSVCMGYAFGYEDLGKPDENHGTVYTGDLAYMDGDGYIFLKGRKANFINILGNRTNLDEMETLLQKKFPELAVVCVGEDDRVAVFSESKKIAGWERNVKQYLMEVAHIPPRLVFCISVKELPCLGNGKTDYKELRKRMKEEQQDGQDKRDY